MRTIKRNEIYRHFKGNYYLIIDIALDCETLEKMVLYRGLYEEAPLWVRSYDDFIKEVDHEKYPNVKAKYRFEKCHIPSQRQKK